MDKPVIILVGGFLGAGKTTLLAAVSERLNRQGKRVGLVTNDQAANLVDTASLEATGSPVEEVSGGCFCCRFDDLIGAIDRLVRLGEPDVILGEPVGSCTDLSATVLQPIKANHSDRFRLAPSSVLVDPDRLRPLLAASPGSDSLPVFPENVLYIYRKQLEEADFIVLNKIDLLSSAERQDIEEALRREYPRSQVMSLSAKEGTGVDAWLEAVACADQAGRTVTEVDYDVYADGEAALGWLNAAYEVHPVPGVDWEAYTQDLVSALRQTFREATAEIAHLKIHLKTGSSRVVANLTSSLAEPSVRGGLPGSPGEPRLLLNVRAHITPGKMREIVDRVVAATDSPRVRLTTQRVECFAPARPEPTHRYTSVV
jgi:Ni2+-binding GTPase involved in maturation of urease and hydrogenase